MGIALFGLLFLTGRVFNRAKTAPPCCDWDGAALDGLGWRGDTFAAFDDAIRAALVILVFFAGLAYGFPALKGLAFCG